jgi:large subunit ribosomal protein L17
MVTSLIKHERIVTTVPKAKELKRLADHVVTLAKSNGRPVLQSIQDANRIIREKPVLTKLFQVLGPRYQARQGGYTRILKLSKRRHGDGAEMAVMEYVDRPGELRAARPAGGIQQGIMEDYIQETLGISPVTGEGMEDLEKELQALNMKGDGVEVLETIEESAAEEKSDEAEKK